MTRIVFALVVVLGLEPRYERRAVRSGVGIWPLKRTLLSRSTMAAGVVAPASTVCSFTVTWLYWLFMSEAAKFQRGSMPPTRAASRSRSPPPRTA